MNKTEGCLIANFATVPGVVTLYIQTDPDEKSMEMLSINLQLARLVGVQETPATIIGDGMIPGAVSWEALEAVVKEKLAVAHVQ